jgi:hypothetical protein
MKLLALFFTLIFVCAGADVAGKWNLVVPGRDGGEMRFTLSLQQSGDKYTGNIMNENGEGLSLSDVRVTESEVKFKILADDASYDVSATVEGAKMKGNFKVNDQPGGTFTATKAAK